GIENVLLDLVTPLLFSNDAHLKKIILENIIQKIFKNTGNRKVLSILGSLLKEQFEDTYLLMLILNTLRYVFDEADVDNDTLNEVLEQLELLLTADSLSVKIDTIHTIRKLFHGCADKKLLNLLTPFLQDSDIDVQIAAVKAICDLFEGSGDLEAYNIVNSTIQSMGYTIYLLRTDIKKEPNKIKFKI
ncbi:MAG: hypothetical protein J7L47_10615, partial [Candidatus Odinarchaeota archaeon]|nr:hypothetical protein [Candidatus Odinarchaeota archaeon]